MAGPSPKTNISHKAARKPGRRAGARSRKPAQDLDIAERGRIWQALLESEDRYRATFDCAPIGIMHTSVETDLILHANPKLSEMLGYAENELLAMTTDDLAHPDHAGIDRPKYREKLLSGELDSFSSERRYRCKGGSYLWVKRTVSLARDSRGKPLYFIRILEDVTARKLAEANLDRLARTRDVMTECTRVLIHASDENAMLQEMCRVAVESGGYKMAWIGLATGDAARPVRPAAHAGFDGDEPMSAPVAWATDGRYRGFMHEVVTTGNPHIARNILNDPAFARRRGRAVQHGFQSSIALPLRSDNVILGAVAIYAREPEAFDADEIAMLTEMADDIAFGLSSLRARAEREQSERKLREIGRRALETFDQAAVGITRTDLNGITVEANQKFCDMLGYAKEEIIGRHIREFTHPEDYGRGARYRDELARGSDARPMSSEKRFLRKDGSFIWARRTLSAARDEDGEVRYVVSVIEDITGRKEAEERYRSTFENAPIGIMYTSIEDDRLLQVNPKLCEMLGYTQEELLQMVTDDMIPAQLRGADRAKYRDRMLHGELKTFSTERRLQRKDGAIIWVNRTISLARDSSGRPLYFIRVIEDITARKELETRFRDTFEQAAVGIIHAALDGRYLRVNRKLCDITGYSEEELTGESAPRLSRPEDVDSGKRDRARLLSGEISSHSNEKRYIRKDGREIWVNRTESLARDESGNPLYLIRVIEDITERKSAERRFEQTFDQAPVGIAHVGLDFKVTMLNRKLCEMFGYEAGELLGRQFGDMSHPDDKGVGDAPRERLLAGLIGQFQQEKRYFRKDGRVIWVRRTMSLARDDAGRPLYYINVMEDVTEHKELERQFRDNFEQAAVGIAHVDFDNNYIRVNRKFCEVTGFAEAELIGKPAAVPSHPEDVGSGNAERARLHAGEITSFSNEKRYIRRDGAQIWVKRTESLARDADGKPVYCIRVIEDITARKQAEEAIARERALLRTVVDAVPDRIYAKDVEGRFLLQNVVNARAHGASQPNDLLGKTVYDIFPHETAKRLELEDRDIVESGKAIIERERALTNHAGETHWISATKVPLRDAEGRIFGLVGMNRDITERKLSALRREMEHAVTRVISEAASVEEAMPRLLATICQAMGWSYGARWVCDERTGVHRADYWSDFELDFDPEDRELWLRQGVEGSMVLLHRVWHHSEPTWIVNIGQHEGFRRSASARRFGLRSAFAFPIVSGGKVIGVMEFFGREVRHPDEMLLYVVRSIGNQIGQFIQRKDAEQALRASEERYRDVFEASPLPMWVSDHQSLEILAVNRAAVEHYGYSEEEFLRMNVRELWAPDEAKRYEQNAPVRARSQSLQLERRHRAKGGRVFDTEITARLFNLGGRTVWLTVANDVSVRMRAEAALRESEEQFRQLAGNIPQVFWITDVTHRETLYVSPAAEAMLGRTMQEILTDRRALIRAIHKHDRARVYAARKSSAEGGYDETYRIVRADGSIRWVHDRAFPVRDAEGGIYRIAGIAEDVTDRKHAEERLEHLAHYDVLTNLPNRVLFYDRLKQALVQARRNRWTSGVMFIDADRFKNVNDTLGHAVGDKLLQQIAGRLTRAVRADDTVGRLGGDEFAIVLSSLASPQDANLVAQKVIAAFNDPFRLEGAEIYVTASIGITLYPDDSTDQDVLIKNADAAMYRAKELGRNSYQFYTPEMNARAMELLGMDSSLRRALERGEFLMHYQPKVGIKDGCITGLEALLRWRHPERGLVPPGDFIPLLEDSGLIVQVGEWVLKAVCTQIKSWERNGERPVPVAVNLSARQFGAKELGPTIKRILDEHEVDPALVELEITESSLMANTEEAVRTLEYLDRLGVGLSIDDFGTGYSSLGYLKRFPISALKIDRSFVRDVTTDTDDATITRAVISMAHSLGLKVIAEGVETKAQLAFLAEHGCDEIQGYYFSRPLPVEECGAWLAERRRLQDTVSPADSGAASVLLVDDDDDALMLLKHTLDREGYRILLARNAGEAIEAVSRQRVDVVIADQNMPGMSGLELLRHVRATYPEAVRLMTSVHADFRTVADAVSRGEVFRFLPKEYTPDQTRASVREALEARRARSHAGG